MIALEQWHRVQQFLFHEARLLDERRLQEWLALYADDAEYWVPYAWEQKSPKDHVSLFYETKSLLSMRIDRLERELSPLDSPMARVNHYLTNLAVEDGAELTARAHLLFVEHRREEQRWFAGALELAPAAARRQLPHRGEARRPAERGPGAGPPALRGALLDGRRCPVAR